MNGTYPLLLKRICLTWYKVGSLGGQLRCSSAVLCLYSPFGKGLDYVLTNSLHPYFKPARITCLKPVHQPISSIQALYSLNFSSTGCFWLLSFAHVGAERQTYIQTTYTHTFPKTILVNQGCAHSRFLASCGRAPGLKEVNKLIF